MTVHSITVFFVEDSAEDRALYRRFLERDDRYTYNIWQFESGDKALQGCQEKAPDVILLDYQLPDLDGLEFLAQLQRQAFSQRISVIMLSGHGDETIAVEAMKSGAQDYLVKGKLTRDSLCRAVHGAIKRMLLVEQLKQQQEQQHLVGAIALDIRKSLKLQDILTTSVQEVRQLLKADRVIVYQIIPSTCGSIVAESVSPEWTPSLGLEIENTCFQESQVEEYRRGKIWTVTDIYEASLTDCHIQFLEQFQVRASLVVPISLENCETQAVELWGLFIAHQCSAPRQWQTFEVELLKQLTVQLAIAIQQAQLYHSLQILNTQLEAKVEERTAALRESEARFQAFMNNSPVLASIADTNGRVLYLNQTYLRTFKLLPEQAIGKSIYHLYPAEIDQEHLDHIRTVIQTNQVLEVMEVASLPDGSIGEFLVYKFPIVGLSAQKLVGRVAIDITERKILERELAHKQQLLDAFISSAPVGLTILDSQLRFRLINQALAEINGIAAADHINQTVWEIMPDLAPELEPVFQYVLTTGETILDLEISGETSKLPGVKRTWLVSCFPIQSQTAQPIGIGIVIVEISDRKRAEQMLELQAVITRNMAEGICLVRTTDAIIVYANPKFEQMFGYNPGELIGQHLSIVNYVNEHTIPEDVNQVIKSAVLQQGEATYEVHNVKKDGTQFWCSVTSSVFEHPEYGSVLVAVQQDITDQKQAKEKIKASLKEKEVLLKEVHHRVKNNLGIVSSLLQMQCRRTQDPQVTAILRDSQNRIASIALVHEKLYRSDDLADIDFAQYIPDLTTHLFDSYNVSSSQIQLKIQVDNASLDIETAIPCGLIINELVSNALKYAFPDNRGGEIEVKFYQESEYTLILVIRDNGIGLPENFDSKKTKTLGITLVQGLVKQLRGKLEIDSHQGIQFKITFTNTRT